MTLRVGQHKVEEFTFPDGQPHIRFETPFVDSFGGMVVSVYASLLNSDDVLSLLLLKEVLDHKGARADLHIKYMLGARMDRRIDDDQPFTLKVIASLIRNAGFERITVLDPHSEETVHQLGAKPVFPTEQFNKVVAGKMGEDFCIVCPDKGAIRRVHELNRSRHRVVYGSKVRDPQTGKLSGFKVGGKVSPKCLIVDDICDGGGTFVGLAKLLREQGAFKVDLFVTHGIFSKGLPLEGIDSVYTTNSIHDEFPGARIIT